MNKDKSKLEVHGCTLTSVTTWHEGNKAGGLAIGTTDIGGEPTREDFYAADEIARRWNMHDELTASLRTLVRGIVNWISGGVSEEDLAKAQAVLAALDGKGAA
jgi:hypothetical protein